MARSTRAPYFTQQQRSRGGTGALAKRQAARAVRATAKGQEAPANGGAYRKQSNPYDIRDWAFYSTDPKARRK